jgi:uncharacterized protein
MPEYLAPGVYVEETSFRSKSIEGVSTTTTGFLGPCRYGPVDLENELVTSLGEFELTYGDRLQLQFGTDYLHNYLWHGVRAFFTEGGKRLYVSRVFRPIDETPGVSGDTKQAAGYVDGCARASFPTAGVAADQVAVRARYPGAYGNFRVLLTLRVGQNVMGVAFRGTTKVPAVTGALNRLDVVIAKQTDTTTTDHSGVYLVDWDTTNQRWQFSVPGSGSSALASDDLAGHELRVVSLTATVLTSDSSLVWDGLGLDPNHMTSGLADSVSAKFGFDASNPALTRSLPIVITLGSNLGNGVALLNALAPNGSDVRAALLNPKSTEDARTIPVQLKDGNDGLRPAATHYEGKVDDATMRKTGLVQFEDLEDISIVAAPGSTFGLAGGYADDGTTIVNLLIAHAQKMRYRIAVLDSGDGQSLGQVRGMRAKIDSSWAALYYPWVRVLDPVTRVPIFLPPSGFVAGIYARNDTNRAVYKAPANEVVNLSIGFEILLNKAQQDVLNPEGINAFRYFDGRGYRLWGARTVSSDPEWKYVNLRRYFAYLERSIDKGTQWAVFEPNSELLWANVRRTIEDFLLNEWQSGALLGDKPEKSYFVRCDRSTMTQNDLDNGRLVCLVGVAPVRPAEFVIFRIGQWTADRKS